MSAAALSLGDVLRRASEHLGKTSETGRLDAELLLAHTLGRERIELYTDFDRPLSSQELDALPRGWWHAVPGTSRSPTSSASGAFAASRSTSTGAR